MEIKTKFKVNDRVWLVLVDEVKDKAYIREFEIYYINIETNGIDVFIEYRIKDVINKSRDIVDEDMFYSTKEEAQKECDRRNKKEIKMKELPKICATCEYCNILDSYHICIFKSPKIVKINNYCCYYKSYNEIKKKIK